MDSSVETPIGRGRFSSCFSCDREWVAALLQAVMREGLIRLLTVVLSSFVAVAQTPTPQIDRKSTRLNSSHVEISYAVFCLKKKHRVYLLYGLGGVFIMGLSIRAML